MTVALEGVQTTLAPMTPDRRIQWERVETGHGILYADLTCPREIADMVISLSRRDMYELNGVRDERHGYGFAERVGATDLGIGTFGIALGLGQVAYKKAFQMNPPAGYFGLSGLRANVALSAGLNAIPQLEGCEARTVRGRSFAITAPQYFAAYFPYTLGEFGPTPDYSSPAYAMSWEAGIQPPRFADLPSSVDRQKRYIEAIAHFGLDPQYVNFDDSAENLLMRVTDDNTSLHLVKLDIAAEHRTDYLYQ